MNIKITNWLTGVVLFECEAQSLKEAVEKAVKAGANLADANLTGAYLADANLTGAYLAGANLAGANLTGANLAGAYLTDANLAGANLTGANLTGAKLDSKHCFLSISPIGSKNGCLWIMKNDDGILMYHRGCFTGTKEEFLEAVKNKHAGTDFEKKYLAAVKFIEVMHEQNP